MADSSTKALGANIGVVTVDDQAHFRSAASDVIDATPGFTALGEAASGPEALDVVTSSEPQLVLVDIRMPGMDGIETSRRIKEVRPEVVVVLVTIQEPDQIPEEASDCGADALVRKQDFGPSLLRRLWSAHNPRGR